jgi:hypothetical protein
LRAVSADSSVEKEHLMNEALTDAVIRFIEALTKLINNANELLEEELKED